jgi:ABC-2 type transport system permease protein
MVVIGNAITLSDPTLNMDVVNEDQDATLSERLINTLDESGGETIRVCQYGQDNADGCGLDAGDDAEDVLTDRLEEAQTSGALIIPPDFTTKLAEGKTPVIEYRSDDTLNAPTVATQALNTALDRVASSVLIARVGTSLLTENSEVDDPNVFNTLYDQAETAWASQPPIVIKNRATNENTLDNGVGQSAPGMATMFVMITMLGGAIVLVVERQMGTLPRLFTLPVPKYQIVIGKMAATMLYGLVQFAVLIIAGTFVGVDWGGNWLAIALIGVAFVLCGGALGFALATVVRTENQAVGISNFMALTLAPLGGAWWPLEIVPDFMVTLGHISPIAWAMDAFHDLIFFNGGLVDVLPEVGVLVAFTVVFVAFGVWQFRYE